MNNQYTEGHAEANESTGTSPPSSPDVAKGRLALAMAEHDHDRAVTHLVEKQRWSHDYAAAVVERAAIELASKATVSARPPKLEPLDLDAEDEAPDWLVTRLIERGTVVVLSGDTGAAKSIVASSLMPAALNDEAWLGYDTSIGRVLMVDEENPKRLARARLRALGIPKGSGDRLRYFSRGGVAIGDGGPWDAWLAGELNDFRPDVLVIDTLMAACDLEDTNSNPEAVRMMKLLRARAEEHACAVLLLHHERKQSAEHPRSSGQAMMGARQWAGQADAHMTLTVESDFLETETGRGTFETRRTFKFRPAEKDRDGQVNRPRRVAVESERDADKNLLWMRVEDEGPIDAETAQDATELAILGALREDDAANRQELAARCGEPNPSEPGGTFKRALAKLIERGSVEKDGRRHRLTEHGRDALPPLDI